MKKSPKKNDEMRDEYDFSHGIRGKYSARFAEGTNIIVLDPAVAEVFPNSKAVNDALKLLVKLIKQNQTKLA